MIGLILLAWVWCPAFAGEAAPPPPATTKPFVSRRAIYCSGLRVAAGQAYVEAACAARAPWRTYHLRVIGAGYSLQLVGSLFRLAVDYPVERYDAAFDPWPGQYYAVITGGAIGIGRAEINAFSGNKTLHGYAFDVGLGVDMTLASLLVIE